MTDLSALRRVTGNRVVVLKDPSGAAVGLACAPLSKRKAVFKYPVHGSTYCGSAKERAENLETRQLVLQRLLEASSLDVVAQLPARLGLPSTWHALKTPMPGTEIHQLITGADTLCQENINATTLLMEAFLKPGDNAFGAGLRCSELAHVLTFQIKARQTHLLIDEADDPALHHQFRRDVRNHPKFGQEVCLDLIPIARGSLATFWADRIERLAPLFAALKTVIAADLAAFIGRILYLLDRARR